MVVVVVVNMILILRKFSIGVKDRYRKATKKQLEQGEARRGLEAAKGVLPVTGVDVFSRPHQ